MSTNINMNRIAKKLKELFQAYIDMSDFPNDESHFKTRALAALSLMMKCGIDVSLSSIHVTDGYNDIGIDAIYLDEQQKQLMLVQSKWREDGQGSISQEEMHVFIEGVKRIIHLEFDGVNEKILSKRDDVDHALSGFDYQIHLIYSHTGNQRLSSYVKRPLDKLLSSTNDDANSLLLFDEILYKDIYAYLACGMESKGLNLDDVIITNWGKIDNPYGSYYGTITASTIGKWYQEYGNKLFAKNIRFYKGNTDVNEGIKRVLLQEPENFFYYNNGIKILCKKVHRKARESTNTSTGLFMLEGVSLVNGAQTTGCIGNVYADNPEQVAKARVLIQIIDLSNTDDGVDSQITRLSNTQNRIDNRDFASLDPVQEKIRQELSFSHYTYLYKSGDRITDPNSQITFDETIIALACLNGEMSYVTLAKAKVGALSEDITKAPYKVLINSGTNSFSIINSVMAVRNIDKMLQDIKINLSGREKLVSIHGNRFISYCVLQRVKHSEGFYSEIISYDCLQKQVSHQFDGLIANITNAVNELFPDSYPANVFKNTTKCRSIYDALISQRL